MHDMFGDEICVGDVLKRVGTGAEREVGMYMELLDSQGLNIARKGIWDGSQYEVIRKAETPIDTENVVKVIDAEPEKPAETPQIVVESRGEDAPEEGQKAQTEEFPFAVLTDEMLVHELRNRGFHGRLEKVVTISYEI